MQTLEIYFNCMHYTQTASECFTKFDICHDWISYIVSSQKD